MNANFYPALVAILLSVPVGIALFTPFVAIHFRREGRLSAGQLLQWVALLLYGIALWTYTLLPLPEPGSYDCLPVQLSPLQFISDIAKYPHSSPQALLRNPAVAQVALNVVLFVPLGVFMRLIWRRGVAASALAGFLASLTIELTQLTGLWGIYGCAYRFFDVDDLIANTAGAVVGAVFALALRRPKATSGGAQTGPTPVTFLRRVVGVLCDVTAIWCVGAVSSLLVVLIARYLDAGPVPDAYSDAASVIVPVALLGALVLSTGRTVGDHATLVRWQGGPPALLAARSMRFLCSPGTWMLAATYLAPALTILMTLTVAITLFSRRDRSGILGLLTSMRPIDARTPADAGASGDRHPA